MNILKNFLKYKEETNKVIGKIGKVPELVECSYSDKLLDTKGNLETIINIMQSPGLNLMIAPTGAGKTESIYLASRELVKRDSNCKVIIAVPIVAIAKQMANSKKDIYEFTGSISLNHKASIIFCTYEKVEKAWELLKNQGYKELYLIIDECHNLTYQQRFREKAIHSLFSFMGQSFFKSILLMTATPDALAILDIDKVLHFKSKTHKPSMDNIEIVVTNDTIGYLKNMDLTNRTTLVRLNNVASIEDIIASNPHWVAITSKDKESKLYRDLVEWGKLKGCSILATSVIQEGVSIKDYEDLEMIFVVDSNFTFDDMEQFFARARRDDWHMVKRAMVLVSETTSNNSHRPFKGIFQYNYDIIKNFITIVEHMKEELKQMANLMNIETLLDSMIRGGIEGLGELAPSILYDMGEVLLDEKMFFLISYRQYQRQGAYDLKFLKANIEERFGVPVMERIEQIAVEDDRVNTKKHTNLWEGLENIRGCIPEDDYFYNLLMGAPIKGNVSVDYMVMVNGVKGNGLLMDALHKLERAGIQGALALEILKNCDHMTSIGKYVEAYQIIEMNKILQCKQTASYKVPHMKKSLYEMQVCIYEIVQSRHKTCFKINDNLLDECIQYYIDEYKVAKTPSKKMVMDIIKKMYLYKDARDDYMKATLRTNERDVFKVV